MKITGLPKAIDVAQLPPEAPAVREDLSKAEIKRVAEEFESLFLNLVMKSMRDTVHKSGLVDGGNAESIYEGMLDGEYTKIMASQRSTGLADNIEQFLLRSIDGQDEKAAAAFAAKAQGLKAYAGRGLQVEGEKRTMGSDPAASSSSLDARPNSRFPVKAL